MRSEVQILPGPPILREAKEGERAREPSDTGAIAQLGERLPCTQEVGSSILPGSTNAIGFYKILEEAIFKDFIALVTTESH